MPPEAAARAATVLVDAWGRRDLERLPADCAPGDTDAAYAVQDALAGRLGLTHAGWKIGCTSAAAQEMLGVDHPFAGRLFAETVYDSPAALAAADFAHRGLEAEFAFLLAADLPAVNGPYDAASVAPAVAALVPAIEIVDPRFADARAAGGLALIADNGAHGALVRGAAIADWQGLDLVGAAVALSIDGAEVGRGTGAEPLGHPLNALAWLANERLRRGDALRAGQLVTTGTCTGLVPAGPTSRAVADYGPLGTVELRFTD